MVRIKLRYIFLEKVENLTLRGRRIIKLERPTDTSFLFFYHPYFIGIKLQA